MSYVSDLAVVPIGGCEDEAKQRVKQHFRKKNIYNKSLESIYKNDNNRLHYEENAVNENLLYIFEQYLTNNSIIADELIKEYIYLDLENLSTWSYTELIANDMQQMQEDLELTFISGVAYTPINYKYKYKDNYTNNYIVCNYSYTYANVNYYSNKKVLSAKLLNYLKSKCKVNNIRCSISNKYNTIYNNYYSKLLKQLIIKMNWR